MLKAIGPLLVLVFPLPLALGQETPAREQDGDGGSDLASVLQPQIVYTGDLFSAVVGGLEQGKDYLADVSLAFAIDPAALVGWEGANFFLYGVGNYGRDPSARIGDLQGVSNIAAPTDIRVHEAWLQQNIARRLSILLGIYDINSEFDVIEAAGLFLHSSFGIGPEFGLSSRHGPSTFPFTTLGARIALQPIRSFFLKAAVMDGEASSVNLGSEDGLLLVGEGVILAGSLGAPLPTHRRLGRGRRAAPYRTKLAFGVWRYTRDFPLLSSAAEPELAFKGGNTGGYALLEHALAIERSRPEQGLTGFLRVGWADPKVNLITFYLGGGVVYDGMFRGRGFDRFGVGIAAAFLGDPARDALRASGRPVDRAEVTLELTYRATLMPILTVQPDFQFVIQPGASHEVENAFVLGLRFELEP